MRANIRFGQLWPGAELVIGILVTGRRTIPGWSELDPIGKE